MFHRFIGRKHPLVTPKRAGKGGKISELKSYRLRPWRCDGTPLAQKVLHEGERPDGAGSSFDYLLSLKMTAVLCQTFARSNVVRKPVA
jgi:hypothetical protein